MTKQRSSTQGGESVANDPRTHIVDVAMDVFLAGGFADTTMDEIARTARISKHTLYGHFRDKAELFEAVIVHDMQRFQNMPDLTKDKRPPEEVLFEAARWIYDNHVGAGTITMNQVLIGAAVNFGELIKRHNAFRFEAGMSWIRTYIQSLADKGVLAIPNPSRAAARFALMASEGSQWVMGVAPVGLKDRERYARLTVALFMGGLLREAKAASA
jgi:TetR/AcrR family transcriptional regulator of autoinduction and epiphytic fitness